MRGMDGAAALLLDGQVIAAASQERFDRVKKSLAFPFEAIQYCINTVGASLEDVQDIGCEIHLWLIQNDLCIRRARALLLAGLPVDRGDRPHPRNTFRWRGGLPSAPDRPSRCACALRAGQRRLRALSGRRDGRMGEISSTSVYLCEGTRIRRLARYPISQSLGMFYSLITEFLGYAFNEDEYKVMGLASFGDPRRYADFFNTAIRLTPNGGAQIPVLTLNHNFADGLFFTNSAAAIQQDLAIDGRNCAEQDRADLSAALQYRFTEALFHICRYFQGRTQATNFVLSGGCAENRAAIGELRTAGIFERIHVAYASGDEGSALGAAACAFARGTPLRIPNLMPFSGPAPQRERVKHLVAQNSALTLEEFSNENAMLDSAADDIADDLIVALCNGRMEYGARALGNRSLLALPGNATKKDRINLAIK